MNQPKLYNPKAILEQLTESKVPIQPGHADYERILSILNDRRPYTEINFLAHVIYFNQEPVAAEEISAAYAQIERPSLEELKAKINPLSYSDLHFMFHLVLNPFFSGKKYAKQTHKFFEFTFNETWGWLCFHSQLEHLYKLATKCDDATAIKFRKDWNKKVVSARKYAKNIFFKGHSLFDLITQSTLSEDAITLDIPTNDSDRLSRMIRATRGV